MRHLLPLTVLSAWLASSLACSTGSADPDLNAGDTAANGSDTGGDGGGTDLPVDETWGVSGTLTLAADLLTSASPVLQTRNPACVADATFTVADPLTTLTVDGVTLRLGWTVVAAPVPDATCTPSTPATFVLGIGPTDASLGPAADKAGLRADHAYGLYLKAGDGPLYLVGLVGTEGQLAGTEDPTAAPPLTDGVYRMVPLFGAPVTP